MAPGALQRQVQRIGQTLDAVFQDGGGGQPQGEVRTVQAPCQAAVSLCRGTLQHLANQAQHLVRGFAPQQAVDLRQIVQTQHQQAGMGGAVIARQRRSQLSQEVLAQVQPREGVAMGLRVQQTQLLGLRLEHALDAHHHRVERLGQAVQLLHRAGLDRHKLPNSQGIGLTHQGIQGTADAPQQRVRQHQRHQGHQCKQAR